MTYNENNIFAKILRGEVPCEKIYEDEYILSFLRNIFKNNTTIISKTRFNRNTFFAMRMSF